MNTTLRNAPSGSLAIFESETGSGKTETSIAHFGRLLELGLVDGCFFALPTRTSAAQIHGRVRWAVDKMFGNGRVPVTLAVPGYLTGGSTGEEIIKSDNASPGPENWHAEMSKRYLASRFAVGTVDQILLSAMHAKHSTLRWSSFGRSLLIVDEVHASDAYMTRILAEVVERHVNRGGHAFLMSATLGSIAAQRFISRTAIATFSSPTLKEATALPYPCIRHVIAGKLTTTPLPPVGRRKSVRIVTRNIMKNAADVAELAAGHVRKGARVLVIRNTVRECVAVQKHLEKLLPPENILRTSNGTNVPHHGRFATEDRVEIDQAIERAFGKNSKRDAVVAVGTQTIEQSLDIDADILITDICPMDVLLQRLGRLHRHTQRMRPEGFEIPTAIALVPDHDLSDFTKKADHGIGTDRAYEQVTQVAITRKEIERRGMLVTPDDNRELVEACTHPESIERFVSENPDYEQQNSKAEGYELARQTAAQSGLRDRDWRYGDHVSDIPKNAASRIGDHGIRLEFKRPCESVLGFNVRGVAIPSYLNKSSPEGLDVVEGLVVTNPCGIEFRVGADLFFYGRYGLEKLNERDQPDRRRPYPGHP
ncbi:CRISPR-associated helicase Cas3' [Roseibium sp. RKSG952]|uniref:CRISPR-associated helicase Cas3' n=1 Tax=Roseibium sp. RKSG952 TaxID=2529384 RepID=UPI0012BC56A9|nr:CRISPR-associated helicase Cas3' [Roseibium sp. RKSG952]MTH95647.1 CRISPR-associated helicase Cas3' [Roseibium sp. RKSG952]